MAEQSSALIYAIGIFAEEDPDKNPGVLNRLARVTGGQAFFPRRLNEVVDVCERIAREMGLHPVGEARWHQFPGGGITGLALLQESHMACHTFPEYGSLCLNVFCCRPRPDWDFEAQLRKDLGAISVEVRRLERPYSA